MLQNTEKSPLKINVLQTRKLLIKRNIQVHDRLQTVGYCLLMVIIIISKIALRLLHVYVA